MQQPEETVTTEKETPMKTRKPPNDKGQQFSREVGVEGGGWGLHQSGSRLTPFLRPQFPNPHHAVSDTASRRGSTWPACSAVSLVRGYADVVA